MAKSYLKHTSMRKNVLIITKQNKKNDKDFSQHKITKKRKVHFYS